MTLWLVGQYRESAQAGVVWDFQGVFSSKEKAVAACRTSSYFVVSVEVDEEAPEEIKPWRVHYPRAQ